MNKKLIAIAVVGALALTGCSTISDPDEVGLYYMKGPSDGYEFGECVDPGRTGPAEWNNEIIYLPASLRTWTIDDAEGSDTKEEIVVSAAPQENQPSGVQVKVATKTSFYLNTYCDSKGGVVREFWEKIGRRYSADTEDGWRKMLLAELVPTQKTIIKDVMRKFDADSLIANKDAIQNAAAKEISDRLAVEFNRLTGGQFFCGPSFVRTKSECPPLELLVIGLEYADPGIQAARNEKQKQLELAAAKVAEAEGIARALVAKANGERDAAAAIAGLYNSPGWVSLQKQIEANKGVIEACRVAKECKLFVGSDGNLIMA